MTKHTKHTLYKGTCDLCEDCTHSFDEKFTYVDLSISDDPIRIIVRDQVCLRCGPALTIEVPECLAPMLEEALVVAGFDIMNDNIEIRYT